MPFGLEFRKVQGSPDSSGEPLPDFQDSGKRLPPGTTATVLRSQNETSKNETPVVARPVDQNPDSFRQSLQEFSGRKKGWQEEIGQKGWEAYSVRPLMMYFGKDIAEAFPLETHSEVLKGILTGLGVLDHEVNRKTLQRAVYYALGVKLDEGMSQETVQKFFKDEIAPRFKHFIDALRQSGFQEAELPRLTRLFSQVTGLNFIDENGVFQISGLTAFLSLSLEEIKKKVGLLKEYRESVPRQLEAKPSDADFDTRFGKVSDSSPPVALFTPDSLLDSLLQPSSFLGQCGVSSGDNKDSLRHAIYSLEMQYRSKVDPLKGEDKQKEEVTAFLDSFIKSRFSLLEEALKKAFPGRPLSEIVLSFSEKSGLHFIDANKDLQPEGLRTLLSLSDVALQKKVDLFREHAEFEVLSILKKSDDTSRKAALKMAEENLPEGSRFGARLFRLFRWLLSLGGVAEKVVDSIVHPPESDKEAKDFVRREELWTALNKHLFGESDQKLPKELFVPQEAESKSNFRIFLDIFRKKHDGAYEDYDSFFKVYINEEEKKQLIEACNLGDFSGEGKHGIVLLKNVFKEKTN